MSQAGTLNISASPYAATTFVTNSGTAIPSSNVINILGIDGETTSGSGSTVTIIPGYMKFISPTIDFTTIGNTTIFTNGSSNFVLYSFTFVSDSIVNYANDARVNIGFTAASYNDLVNNAVTVLSATGQFIDYSLIPGSFSGAHPLLPPSTPLVARVSSGATADVYSGRCIIFGFTV